MNNSLDNIAKSIEEMQLTPQDLEYVKRVLQVKEQADIQNIIINSITIPAFKSKRFTDKILGIICKDNLDSLWNKYRATNPPERIYP